jgi:hypothetical protein
MSDEQKVPTRPGSKWATGRRRAGEPPVERAGFSKGARVTRTSPSQPARKTRHRSKK